MLLELFNECTRGRDYLQTEGKVDWKIVDGVMYFRQSVEKEDWYRNFLSILPILVYLKGWQFVPLGAWLTYLQVRKIARFKVTNYVGYSQGGWPAVYASLENNTSAVVFGCPRSTSRPNLYKKVLAYKNPDDVVTMLPTWPKEAGKVITLEGTSVIWPEDPTILDLVNQATGHLPEEYRQRLADVDTAFC